MKKEPGFTPGFLYACNRYSIKTKIMFFINKTGEVKGYAHREMYLTELKNRCDEVQGYLLGKPASITELNLNANRIDL